MHLSSKISLTQTLLVENEYVTTILDKANLFSNFFREQYRPIRSHNTFPNVQINGTVTRLYDFNINVNISLEMFRG